VDDLRWKKDRDFDNLISEQRRAIIFDVVWQRGLAGVQELSDLTGTSVSTARRYLAELEQRGPVKRTHRRAMLNLSLRTTFKPEHEFAYKTSQPEK
jgi:DeoR/GlpR family transcriptional regulator of sugar metabolism